MRFPSAVVLALPALAIAEEQIPLGDKIKGLWNKVTDAVTSAVPVPAAASSPVAAGAAQVAKSVQYQLSADNWKDVLAHDPKVSPPTEQQWLVYVNGGNTTCFGFCDRAYKAWNESVALLSAKPIHPKFAVLDCETEPVLCNSWSIGPPSLYHMSIPKPLADQTPVAPTVRYIPLNRTSVATTDIVKLVANDEYKNVEPYEGVFHPFTGLLQQYNLAIPVGYIIWGFGKMPTWLPMILISFISRSFMGRRMPQGQPQQGATAGTAAR